MYIFITGRESGIARAELEAVFGKIETINNEVVAVNSEHIDTNSLYKLGFSKEVAKVHVTKAKMETLDQAISEVILQSSEITTGKISFGISWYSNARCDQKTYMNLSKNVKKHLQAAGRSARFISPKDSFRLNAAQVQHNNLIKKGCEIVISDIDRDIAIAQTIWVFNPTNYSKRDYDRPVRPTKVGMFPPKLAQVLINLSKPTKDEIIVDPFCGSGVVLQEAMYAEHNTIGSDNSEDMVKAAQTNLVWFQKEFSNNQNFTVDLADARDFIAPADSYSIVSEGYLGPAFYGEISKAHVQDVQKELSRLYTDFLTQVWSQKNQPNCVVITLPVWKTSSGILKLNIIDQITELGYTIRQFQSISTEQLVYMRPDQTVGRQILVLDCKNR